LVIVLPEDGCHQPKRVADLAVRYYSTFLIITYITYVYAVNWYQIYKGKGKGQPRTGHEGPEGE